MHRDDALRPFSRGHQRILFHAREMRDRGEAAVAAFLAYAAEDLPRHLDTEERVLFPALLARLPGGDASLDRARAAHAAIREAVARLRAADPGIDRGPELARLAGLLRDHARDEERNLFPLVERVLGPEGLADLARRLGGARVI